MAGTTGPSGDAAALRQIMNEIIGSRAAKAQLARDGRLAPIAALLVAPEVTTEERILAAHILGSVAQHAVPATLLALLHCDVPFLLLLCLGACAAEVRRAPTHATATHLARLLEAVVRALRAVMCSVAEQIGHSPRLGIGSEWGVASMGGLEHGDARPASAHSEAAQALPGAGPSASDARRTIAARWMASVPASVWAERHAHAAGERNAKAVKTGKDAPHATRSPPPGANYAEYLAMCASLDEAEALASCDAYATLNWLSRSAVSTLFDQKSLHLLLGALVLANDSLQSGTKPTSSVHSDRATPMSASTPSLPLPTAPLTPILGRAQALSVLETVCELLGACLTVYGIENYPSSPAGARLRFARLAAPAPPTNASHGNEIARRYDAFLHFAAWDNPFVPHDTTTSSPLDTPGYTALVALLGAAESSGARVQEAALWLLHELLASCPDAGVPALLSLYSPRGTLLPHVVQMHAQHARTRSLRLVAHSCLVELLDAPSPPMSGAQLVHGVMGMLEAHGAVQVQACFTLARLVHDRPELQALAVERHSACERLGALLVDVQERLGPHIAPSGRAAVLNDDELALRLQEAGLTALAALATQSDAVRRRIVACVPSFLSAVLLPALSSCAVGVQIAACRLIRVLSRTIGLLRTSLLDAGVAERMLALLRNDAHAFIHAEVLASVCNMLVKFSPMKPFLLEHGGIRTLAQYARSAHGGVRLNALWAIKNAVWDSETPLKEQIMREFGWDYLAEMAVSPDACIQEQALGIVRNLTSARNADTAAVDIEMTLTHFGEDRLFTVVEDAVWSLQNDAATEQAAFILANLASGSQRHRALITDRPNILDALSSFLEHPRDAVREAGVRCGYNLTHPLTASAKDPGMDDEWHRAIARLRAFGFDKRLSALENDPDPNVRERVRDTLAQM